MAIGFVLVKTAPTKEHDVFTALMAVHGVKEVHILFGDYDLIAKVEAENFDKIGKLVINRIRKIPGVTDTKTLTGLEF
jgi:DNA-binding Lrp family transcriptional regulator